MHVQDVSLLAQIQIQQGRRVSFGLHVEVATNSRLLQFLEDAREVAIFKREIKRNRGKDREGEREREIKSERD